MRQRLFNRISLSIAAALLACDYRGARAQSGVIPGLEGGPEFLLPIGARGIGLGQAIAARGVGADALWWNPALIARGPREVAFNVAQLANGSITADASSAIVWPVPRVGAFALSVRYLNYGDFTATDKQTGAIIGSFQHTAVIVAGTFSAPFGDRFAGGLTLKLLELASPCTGSCDPTSSGEPRTAALDFGAQYFLTADSLISVGASTLNIGLPLQVKDAPQADQLPSRVIFGAAVAPKFSQMPKGAHMHAEVDMIKALSSGGPGFLLGAEFAWMDQYAARVGYQHDGPTSGVGPTFGLGFATGKLHIDFSQMFTDANTGLGKPTFLSIRYVF